MRKLPPSLLFNGNHLIWSSTNLVRKRLTEYVPAPTGLSVESKV